MKYGLVGKSLGHSYSKLIHEQLDSKPYDLISLDENQLDTFLKEKDFLGINVTIPYKEIVKKYLDEIDEVAKEIGSINAITNKDGKLKGYNTDYYGLKKLFISSSIEVKDKHCFILGSGGTKNTAFKVLKDLGAKSINIVSRTKSDRTITYEEFNKLDNVQIIVNTTPIGMYPNIEGEIINLDNFSNLEGVVDVVYNPYNTRLVTKAKLKGIKAIGGLKMLVEQGIKASELFTSTTYSTSKYEEVFSSLYSSRRNIVLIGLPMSGKTTVGIKLATSLNKEFIDLDHEIEKEANMSISSIFSTYGEEYFRKLEKEITLKYSKETNLIISTGGGIIKDEENMLNLMANGFIVHLTRDEDKLIYSSTRPLTKNKGDYLLLKKQREPLYKKYASLSIDNSHSIDECVEKIKEAFYENINY